MASSRAVPKDVLRWIRGKVEFFLSREQLGGYKVDVEGLRGAFEVTSSGFSLLPQGEAAATFVIKNLVVEPPEVVMPGEPVRISVDVAHEGGQIGSFSAILKVRSPGDTDFSPVDVKEITLRPGEKGTVRFFLRREERGRYEVDVEGVRATFEVPTHELPRIRLAALIITPERTIPGQAVDVRLDVDNVGAEPGRVDLEFRVNGVLFELRSVEVPGQSLVEVIFEFTPPADGEFELEVIDSQGILQPRRGILTAKIQAPPASFEFSDLRIFPQEVEPGQEIVVEVLVTNSGQRPGKVMVELLLDGPVIERLEVAMADLSTETVTFKLPAPDRAGNYEITVGNAHGVLRVGAPTRLDAAPAQGEPSKDSTLGSLLRLVPPLAIAPTHVQVGQTVIIGAVVRNSGAVQAETEIVLRAEGEEMRRRSVIVPGGEDTVVKFEVTPKDPGVYEVQLEAPAAPELGVLRGLVSVSEADSAAIPTPTPTLAPPPKVGTDESKGFCSTASASSGSIYGGWLLLSLTLVGLLYRTRCWPRLRG